ncbi:MAG: helix-turn-helix domain-containing protein [Bacillota bacterium]|nr:helix-turn-helix domain-containing protein [Bacillota bacterium]
MQTRGVVTPSDFLTEEERQKLSGPVVTYMLSKPLKDQPVPKPPAPAQSSPLPQPVASPGESRPELTRDAMVELLRQGKSTSQLARLFGVSRGTINNRKRAWGLRRQVEVCPSGAPAGEEKKGQVQIEVSEVLEAAAAEKLLRNLAAFVSADGGHYELTLRICRQTGRETDEKPATGNVLQRR